MLHHMPNERLMAQVRRRRRPSASERSKSDDESRELPLTDRKIIPEAIHHCPTSLPPLVELHRRPTPFPRSRLRAYGIGSETHTDFYALEGLLPAR